MVNVIIAAKKKDDVFWREISSMLEKNFHAITVHERKLKANCTAPELIVTDIDSFCSIQSQDTIIIFKDPVKMDIEDSGGRMTVAVVDSQNIKLGPIVASTGIPAITCGLSARDTITLSSIRTDSAVIDLQRSVTCFDNSIVEPQDIPVNLEKPVDSFALMAVASVCILTGKIDRLEAIKL